METGLENFSILLPVCGLVYVIAGLCMFYYPPKTINHLYGYRTARSMKNPQNWQVAQKYSTKLLLVQGLVFLLLTPYPGLFGLDPVVVLCIDLILLGCGIGWMLYFTEKRLKMLPE